VHIPRLSKCVRVIPGSAVAACEAGRKRLRHPREVDVVMNAALGHGVWEGVIENLAAPGQSLLVPGTGHFGESWAI
jgi:alanine-glyoxylate transaminase/serine-glyoxylate transaminase/serine-pyruvate transaminase